MIRLTKKQVLMLHTQLIESTGGCDGIRDYGLLDSACVMIAKPIISPDFTVEDIHKIRGTMNGISLKNRDKTLDF